MKTIVLGVSGSVAAYRACDIARELMRRGFTVRTCLTDSAQRFVTAELFEALTGEPCLVDTFEEPDKGRMAHIDWARQASALLIAPATANTINKLANGYADDMLTSLALAFEGPIVVAPAMNPTMLAHPATAASLQLLRARAALVVEPAEGDVACGESGQGKLASVESIVAATVLVCQMSEALAGKKVLITSGPTEEPIDDVRMLTNRSTGKMGAALAKAALMMGADVTVVAGPQREPLPSRAKVINVRTAEEMLAAALPLARDADLIVGVAAVSDYRASSPQAGKIRSGQSGLHLDLEPTPDIITKLASETNGIVVAFAAEPDGDLRAAGEKLDKKGVSAIAVNNVGRGDVGFDSDSNELTLLRPGKQPVSSGKVSKLQCAVWLLNQILDESS
ncbi:MAG: bifunctional phosphopantothenoylcysteine decarboxylase/phosphopantothenate--cysteine ligase CoaBC [Armatimonadetes bacterium]|nr:bifunctional phosphopantothenoylcysteine decarboxylase/phosphopantothenate--cysteine ligase CoaBC [Armatimonadota bacterium]